MEFRLTVPKAKEYLGESLLNEIMFPEKSSYYRFRTRYAPLAIIGLLVLSFFSKKFFLIPFFLAVGIITYFADKRRASWRVNSLVAKFLKSLVADRELKWLNDQKELLGIPSRLKRSGGRAILDATDYEVLTFLKKNKSSQGMHSAIPSFKNSNSVNKKLGRMETRGLVVKTGNDYAYVPWTFKILDDSSERGLALEKVLASAWERLIDGKKNVPVLVLLRT